ncbi:MAG: barstar family protein [Bacteroidota bacterium]
MRTVSIDTAAIVDRPSFHRAFQEAFGFPEFYGTNMDAWIDCLGHLDDPEAGMSEVTVREGEVLVLELAGALDFAYRCPDIWEDLIDGAAFVNQRRVDRGRPGILSLLLR